jgi:hypothetical protein
VYLNYGPEQPQSGQSSDVGGHARLGWFWSRLGAPRTYTLGHQPADEATSGRDRSAALSEARSKTLLTEQGEIALRHARKVLEMNDEMIDTLRGSSLSGAVRIGFGQDFVGIVLPRYSRALVRFTP